MHLLDVKTGDTNSYGQSGWRAIQESYRDGAGVRVAERLDEYLHA